MRIGLVRKSVVRRSALVCALALLAVLGLDGRAAELPDGCPSALSRAETRYGLPTGLLMAMAQVESGRLDPATGRVVPWPWTIQAGGRSYFYASASEAIRGAKAILKTGNGFVDVGCLQVDLYHHPDAFQTLDAAFNPATNVDYAARYLLSLARERGSWLEAVAAYNAGDPAAGMDYLDKVLYRWKGVRVTASAPRRPASRPIP